MIIGAHSIIYSTNPDSDRKFLQDVLKLPNVDVGEGWLIFGLPPAEVAVHPSDENNLHEFYLMCDDVDAFIAEMKKRKIDCSVVHNQGWGLLTLVTLPGGGKLGVYQPRHARPKSMSVRTPSKPASARKAAKKPAKPAPKKAGKKSAAKTSKKKPRGR
jgi:hypothetical protein